MASIRVALQHRIELAEANGQLDELRRLRAELKALMSRATLVSRRAIAATKQGNDVEATRAWLELTELVDGSWGATACGFVGNAFKDGIGIAPDPQEALRYLRAAGSAGSIAAASSLARALGDGDGVPQDLSESARWYEFAANAGHVDANLFLGMAYFDGLGVVQDWPRALRHFRIAATSKTKTNGAFKVRSIAENKLAAAYGLGAGCEQSDAIAAYWYQQASRHAAPGQPPWADWMEASSEDGKPKSFYLPLGVAAFAVCAVLAATVWPTLTTNERVSAGFLVASVGILPLIFLVLHGAQAAQQKIREEFASALMSGRQAMKIGGRKWTIVEGEFRHLQFDGGERGSLYEPKSPRSEREAAELLVLQERQYTVRVVVTAAVIAWALGAAGVLAHTHAMVISAGVLAFLSWIVGAEWLVWSYRYRHGDQTVTGAMVLDPPAVKAGREEVESQRALGDARLASELEVQAAAAKGGAPRSPIHEQKF